jgi:hypothetical protein
VHANFLLVAGNNVRTDVLIHAAGAARRECEKITGSFCQPLSTLAHQYIACAVVYALALLIFFTSAINMSPQKYMVLAGIIGTYGLLFYGSYRHWMKQLSQLREALKEF